MKRFSVLSLVFVLAACQGGAVSRSLPVQPCHECVCDCPSGPPKPPAIDTFCASDANDGKACCRKLDGSEIGVCANHECVAVGSM